MANCNLVPSFLTRRRAVVKYVLCWEKNPFLELFLTSVRENKQTLRIARAILPYTDYFPRVPTQTNISSFFTHTHTHKTHTNTRCMECLAKHLVDSAMSCVRLIGVNTRFKLRERRETFPPPFCVQAILPSDLL